MITYTDEEKLALLETALEAIGECPGSISNVIKAHDLIEAEIKDLQRIMRATAEHEIEQAARDTADHLSYIHSQQL